MQHVRETRQRREVPYSKLGCRVNVLLEEKLRELTCDVRIAVKTGETPTAAREHSLTQDRWTLVRRWG